MVKHADTTLPLDETHPLDWIRMEVSARFCEQHEYYPAVVINPKKHALRKMIYDFNEAQG